MSNSIIRIKSSGSSTSVSGGGPGGYSVGLYLNDTNVASTTLATSGASGLSDGSWDYDATLSNLGSAIAQYFRSSILTASSTVGSGAMTRRGSASTTGFNSAAVLRLRLMIGVETGAAGYYVSSEYVTVELLQSP